MHKKNLSNSNVIYTIAAVILCFIICEVFLRVFWQPADKEFYKYYKNPYLRLVYFPNKEITKKTKNNEERTIKTNTFGLRSSSTKTIKKAPNTYRIFIIGESTVEQGNLPEEETSWKIMENYLNEQSKSAKFECINAGYPGSYTADSLALLAHEIIYYEPDMILIMHAINDMLKGFLYPDYSPLKKELVYNNLPLKDTLKEIYLKSYLLIFVKRNIFDVATKASYLKHRTLDDYAAAYKKTKKEKFTQFPSLDEYKKNIKSLIGIAKTNNIRILFLTQPNLLSENMSEESRNVVWLPLVANDCAPDIETLYKGMGLFNSQIKVMCEKENIEYIDLESKIPKNLEYFYDHVHYTAKGAKLVGDTVADYIWDNRPKINR